jgi:DNA-binding response OmpR family regulator
VTPTRPRILFVEDDKHVRDIYELLLVQNGFNVTPCGTVAAACMHLDISDLYGVVLDLRLPNGHGLRVVQELVAKRNDVPVVIFSAFHGEHEWTFPIVAALRKPPTRDEFLGAVRLAVSKSTEIRTIRETTRRLREVTGVK